MKFKKANLSDFEYYVKVRNRNEFQFFFLIYLFIP